MGFLSGVTSFLKEHSAIIHGVLDLAGFIPGVGAVADLANAAVYVAEGDYMNASLSAISAIPGIGDTVALAKKSTKVIKGGAKAMKEMRAVAKAEKMKGLFGLLRGKAQTGAKKLAGKKADLKELLRDLKNGDKKLCLFGKCFTGDILVYTKKGYIPIKEIRKGDDIYSKNADTGDIGLKEVEEIFQTEAHTIYHIWLNGKEKIKTTAYHPIYVEEKGWVTAINLREKDPVQTAAGTAYITKIEKKRHEEPVTVYNLHVKEWASFFVSTMQIYVHNKVGATHKINKAEALEPLENGPYIKNGKPNGRPGPRGKKKDAFEMEVYKQQVDPDGILRDPNPPHEVINWKPGDPRKGVVDFGHKQGHSYHEMFQKYKNREITLDELKEFQENAKNFQLEVPHKNRGHKYE